MTSPADDAAAGARGAPPSAAVLAVYELATANAVVPVALGVGVVCLGYVPLHLATVPGATGVLLAACAAFTAVTGLGMFAALRGRPMRQGTAHPRMAVLVVLTVWNSALDIGTSADMTATTNFVIVIIGIGVCMISPRWVAAMLTFAVLSWLAVVATQHPVQTWMEPGATVVGGVALSVVISVSRRRTLAALVRARERAELASVVDVLTGLYNRRGFSLVGAELVRATRRTAPGYSVVVLDVDRFKAVNDLLGHEAGDRVLEQVGHLLASCFRAGDVVSRWGGDEFAVVATGNPMPVDELADRLNASLTQCAADKSIASITVSVGIASAGAQTVNGDIDLDAMFAAADSDMYARRARRRRHSDDDNSTHETAAIPL